MNKVAKRLILISLIAAAGVVFFLNRVLNSPSNLVRLIPKDAKAYIHFNTREVAKDVYRYGGFSLDSLSFFSEKHPYFDLVDDPRNIGINVYSELFLFEHRVDNLQYWTLMFNLVNHNNFVHFCESNPMLKPIEVKENEALFYGEQDNIYLNVREKEAMVFFGLRSKSDAKNLRRDLFDALPHETFSYKGKDRPDITVWQRDTSDLLKDHFPFLVGEGQLEGNFAPGSFSFQGHSKEKFEGTLPFELKLEAQDSNYTFSTTLTSPRKEEHSLAHIINLWRTLPQHN